jgi:hypothetical protein
MLSLHRTLQVVARRTALVLVVACCGVATADDKAIGLVEG